MTVTPNELYLNNLRAKQKGLKLHLDKYAHVLEYEDVDRVKLSVYTELHQQILTRLSEIETDIAMAERSQTNGA